MDKLSIIKELYSKYLSDKISSEEKLTLFDFFSTANDEEISAVVSEFLENAEMPGNLNYLERHTSLLFEQIRLKTFGKNSVQPQKTDHAKLIKFIIRAAAAILAIALGTYLFTQYRQKINNLDPDKIVMEDIAPGKNGATLTLANGQQIVLGTAENGQIATQAGVKVSKTADGQLLYEITKGAAGNNEKNTLTTANGETYILALPDGSKVWMNSASSLTYSAALVEGPVRRVRLEGEAYFEIAKDKAHPFVVETARQRVTVLGTHFNVNAYGETEGTKTTLLEGSVKVVSLADTLKPTILKPKQEATLGTGGIVVHEVDPEFATAWKDGFFMFDDEDLESVMNRIARWYDVKILFKDPSLKNNTFVGTMNRYDNISKVLQVLQRTQVATFELEGRTITVKKKK